MKFRLKSLMTVWIFVLGAGWPPAGTQAADGPMAPLCQPRAHTREHEALFEWARGLRDLKGDGDFRTMSSDAYQDDYYELGAALLSNLAGVDLYALDADCRSLLNYAAPDARAYELLLTAGYQTRRAVQVYSPLLDALYFWIGQLAWTRNSDAFETHFEKLASQLDVNHRNPDGKTPLAEALAYGEFELSEILRQAGAR